MDAEEVRKRIAEYAGMRPAPGSDDVAQVEAAMFIENVFGIALTDDDMNETTLGTHDAIEAFVLTKLGVK